MVDEDSSYMKITLLRKVCECVNEQEQITGSWGHGSHKVTVM